MLREITATLRGPFDRRASGRPGRSPRRSTIALAGCARRRLRHQGSAEAAGACRDGAFDIGAGKARQSGRKRRRRAEPRNPRRHRSHDRFVRVNGDLCVERVPLADIAARFGTPCFVYSRAALEAAWTDVRRRLRRRASPRLLCDEGELQSRRAECLRTPGQRLRHRLRRRARTRAGRRRRSREGRVFRRRQDRGRDGSRDASGHPAASTSNRPPSSRR